MQPMQRSQVPTSGSRPVMFLMKVMTEGMRVAPPTSRTLDRGVPPAPLTLRLGVICVGGITDQRERLWLHMHKHVQTCGMQAWPAPQRGAHTRVWYRRGVVGRMGVGERLAERRAGRGGVSHDYIKGRHSHHTQWQEQE